MTAAMISWLSTRTRQHNASKIMNLADVVSKMTTFIVVKSLTGQSNSAQFMSMTDNKPPKGMIEIDFSLWKELFLMRGRRKWTREKIGS
jgi:hypothetical protein